jgi:hypothetical protein
VTVPEELARIHAVLHLLARRERTLLALRASVQVIGAFLAIGLLSVLLCALRIPRGLALGSVVGLGGLAIWAAAAFPLLLRWFKAANPSRQALLVERRRPELRGRLVTVAERPEGPLPGENGLILGLAARKAAVALTQIGVRQVHPVETLRAPLLASLALGLTLLLSGMVAPAGPIDSLRLLFAPDLALAKAAVPDRADESPRALVGDIAIRYFYPAYTRLEPLEVKNSTGDLHAPPGTIVELSARTAELFEAASLLVEPPETPSGTASTESASPATAVPSEAFVADRGRSADATAKTSSTDRTARQAWVEPAERSTSPVTLEAGRNLSCSFEIKGEGTWTFLLYRAGAVERSTEHTIVVEPDMPPEVLVEAPASELEIDWDQPIPVSWSAHDDYGLIRAEVVVTTAGRELEPKKLRTLLDQPLRVQGDLLSLTPLALGLHPGDEAGLQVVAWDNDGVAGSKRGESRMLKLSVLGPQGRASLTLKRIEELRNLLIGVLGDFLEEPFPPDRDAASMTAWAGELARRIEPVDELYDRYWHAMEPDSFEGTVIATVRRSYATLLGFARVLCDARPSDASALPSFLAELLPQDGNAAADTDRATLKALRDDTILQVEHGILTLDEVMRMSVLARIARMSHDLVDEVRKLADLQDPTDAELLAGLDRLERELERLSQAIAKLSAGSLQDFVNDRAATMKSLVDQIREAIAQGRDEDARKLLQRLATEVAELSQALQDMQQGSDENSRKAMAEALQLKEELKALEQSERDLAEQTGQLSQENEQAADLAHRWAELSRRAAALSERLSALDRRLGSDERRNPSEAGLANRAASAALQLSTALQANDVTRGLRAARDVERAIQRLGETTRWMAQMRAELGTPASGEAELRNEIGGDSKEATALREELEKMTSDRSQVSPQVVAAAQQLAEQQDQLRQQAQKANRTAQHLSQDFAMHAPGLSEGVSQAEQEMGAASDQLRAGQPQEGEGSQRSSADNLASAREALERAMRDQQQMAQFQEGEGDDGGQASGEGEAGDKGGRPQPAMGDRVEIPVPEEFRTPEAYRKALLEGMSGAVPEEYEALKKRYYEELVRQ